MMSRHHRFNNQNQRNNSNGNGGRVCCQSSTICGAVFACVCCGFLFISAGSGLVYTNSHFGLWINADATITGRRQQVSGDDLGDVNVEYCAEVNFQTQDGMRNVTTILDTYCADVASSIPVGEKREILYNPSDPEDIFDEEIYSQIGSGLGGTLALTAVCSCGYMICALLLCRSMANNSSDNNDNNHTNINTFANNNNDNSNVYQTPNAQHNQEQPSVPVVHDTMDPYGSSAPNQQQQQQYSYQQQAGSDPVTNSVVPAFAEAPPAAAAAAAPNETTAVPFASASKIEPEMEVAPFAEASLIPPDHYVSPVVAVAGGPSNNNNNNVPPPQPPQRPTTNSNTYVSPSEVDNPNPGPVLSFR